MLGEKLFIKQKIDIIKDIKALEINNKMTKGNSLKKIIKFLTRRHFLTLFDISDK